MPRLHRPKYRSRSAVIATREGKHVRQLQAWFTNRPFGPTSERRAASVMTGNAMLTMDLGDGKGGLHPLAPFKVLIVMCYPAPGMHKQREQMLGCIQRETAIVPTPSTPADICCLWRCCGATLKGMVAGSMLLYMLQLRGNGKAADVGTALNYVITQLPLWKQPEGDSGWPDAAHFGVRHQQIKCAGCVQGLPFSRASLGRGASWNSA